MSCIPCARVICQGQEIDFAGKCLNVIVAGVHFFFALARNVSVSHISRNKIKENDIILNLFFRKPDARINRRTRRIIFRESRRFTRNTVCTYTFRTPFPRPAAISQITSDVSRPNWQAIFSKFIHGDSLYYHLNPYYVIRLYLTTNIV